MDLIHVSQTAVRRQILMSTAMHHPIRGIAERLSVSLEGLLYSIGLIKDSILEAAP
jgi:hypothetical protein